MSVPAAPQLVRPSPVMFAVVAVRSPPAATHAVAPWGDEVPAPHAEQLPAFAVFEYVPAPHAVHARSPVALPALETKVPPWHVVHTVHADAFPAAENAPFAHGAQLRFVAALGALLTYSPTVQLVHAAHADALVAALNFPAAQPVHTRSITGVPAVSTYSPGTQTFHGVHRAAFVVLAYVPPAHALHAAPLTYVPGPQLGPASLPGTLASGMPASCTPASAHRPQSTVFTSPQRFADVSAPQAFRAPAHCDGTLSGVHAASAPAVYEGSLPAGTSTISQAPSTHVSIAPHTFVGVPLQLWSGGHMLAGYTRSHATFSGIRSISMPLGGSTTRAAL